MSLSHLTKLLGVPRHHDKHSRSDGRHIQLSLESLEQRQLLTGAPEIIMADESSALTAAKESPGFRSVMLQPSGKIVAAGSFRGSQGDDFTLVRYTPDGLQLDSSFGGDGVVQVQFQFNWQAQASARHAVGS